MKNLKDKVAVVTGASSGIGRSLAINLGMEGCHLALADVDSAGLQETVQLINNNHIKVTSHVVDVSNRDQVFEFAETAIKEHESVDIVVNNAGVGLSGSLTEVSIEEFEWLMGINFWGVVYGSKAFIPFLNQRPQASLVNISSVHGLFTNPGVGPYCSSKFAVRGFTLALTQELRETNIVVSCVHPGGIKTNIVINSRIAENSKPEKSPEESQLDFDRVFARSTADQAAKIIIKGIKKKKSRILIGWDAHVYDMAARLFPVAWQKLMGAILNLFDSNDK